MRTSRSSSVDAGCIFINQRSTPLTCDTHSLLMLNPRLVKLAICIVSLFHLILGYIRSRVTTWNKKKNTISLMHFKFETNRKGCNRLNSSQNSKTAVCVSWKCVKPNILAFSEFAIISHPYTWVLHKRAMHAFLLNLSTCLCFGDESSFVESNSGADFVVSEKRICLKLEKRTEDSKEIQIVENSISVTELDAFV